MFKLYIITILFLEVNLLAATPEQVEQYISVSGVEERLISMESQLSKKKETNTTSNKDMQILSIRFKEDLQKHLSENEMDSILDNYKNVLLLQFVSEANLNNELNSSTISSYIKKFKKMPESKIRMDIIDKINEKFYSEKSILILFDELMKPNLVKNGIDGQKVDEDILKEIKKDYLKMAIESSRNQALYTCREFTNEQLEQLLKIAKTPAVDHETKAVYGAMAYALKEFINANSLSSTKNK